MRRRWYRGAPSKRSLYRLIARFGVDELVHDKLFFLELIAERIVGRVEIERDFRFVVYGRRLAKKAGQLFRILLAQASVGIELIEMTFDIIETSFGSLHLIVRFISQVAKLDDVRGWSLSEIVSPIGKWKLLQIGPSRFHTIAIDHGVLTHGHENHRVIGQLIDESRNATRRLMDRFEATVPKDRFGITAALKKLLHDVLDRLFAKERFQVEPSRQSLIEGFEPRVSESFLKTWATEEYQSHASLAVGSEVGERAELIEQRHRKIVCFVDQQQNAGGTHGFIAEVINQVQPKFAFLHVAVRQAQFIENGLQQRAARAKAPAREHEHAAEMAEGFGQRQAQKRLASADRTDHNRRAFLAFDQTHECRSRRFD